MKGKILLGIVGAAVVVGTTFYTRTARHAPSVDQSDTADASTASQAAARRSALVDTQRAVPAGNPVNPEVATTNWLALRLKGEPAPHLTSEQAEAYLARFQRGAENLLAASDATGDRKYLQEAMDKFPNDPRVAFRAALLSAPDADEAESGQIRRKWLDTLKQSAPDNALGDYLSAAEHFRAGEKDMAVQEIAAGAQKPIQDYSLDFMLNTEEAYRNAGYSEAQAKAIAADSLLLPQLAQYKSAGVSLVDLGKSYQQAGDGAAAQAAFQMSIDFGKRLNTPDSLTLIGPLVGMAIERIAYNAMGPSNPYGTSGQTVQNQIDAIVQERAAFKQLTQQEVTVLSKLSESELAGYLDRQRISGSVAAIRWAVAKYGQ